MSFKEYNQDQPFLLPLSLHDFLPDAEGSGSQRAVGQVYFLVITYSAS